MHHFKLIAIVFVVALVAIWASGGRPLGKFVGSKA
jgi:hypothetical protein